jgi:1-acyl-sn-glycerol-3-phosphate acyltransferase
MAEQVAGRPYVYRGEGTTLLQRCAWNTGRALSRLIALVLFRLQVQGRENVPNTGAVLLVTNHQSFLDPWLIGIRLRRQIHYMARDTLFKGGFLHWLMELLNAYPVKRGAADLHAIRETANRLEQGRVVNIFPEGTRTTDGSIGTVSPGIILILKRMKGPLAILPVVIEGAFEAWPRHQKLPHAHAIRIAYGTPVLAEELKGLSADEVAAQLRQRMVALQAQLNSPHAGESRRRLQSDAAQRPPRERRGER